MTDRLDLVDLYELSPMQQGMLFHSLYAPDSGLYIEQRCCQIRGIQVAAFQTAWQQVCDRHAILRTAFLWEEFDKPLQVVYESVKLPWIEQDWRTLPATTQPEQFVAWLQADREQGFVLNQAPLMRCALLQITDDAYYFVWTHHHLLLDGWCNALLLQEVFAYYEAELQNQTVTQTVTFTLPPSPPYRNYILWLQQQDKTAIERFWRRALQGFTAPTLMLEAVPSPSQETDPAGYREQHLIFTPALTNELQTFAQRHRLTLNTLIQGAWAILLSRYSHTTDVLFGMTVSGRPPELDGIEAMIGLFINTVPVRVQLDPDAPLVAWLQQLQTQEAEQMPYSYSPLVDIQAWSEIPQGMPLFDSLLVVENYPTSITAALQLYQQTLQQTHHPHSLPLHIEPLPITHSIAQTNYPLTITVLPGSSLTLQFSYDRQRIADETVQRLLGHLETLLTAFLDSPNQPLAVIPILTAAEQQQLRQWHQTHKFYSPLAPVHQVIAAQAARTPDAIALVCQDQQITYGELNARANQLAYWLQQDLNANGDANGNINADTHGCTERNSLIGICLERSSEQIISLLAVLKAGAAYLPLDPSYPPERLTWMLEDAQVKLVITQSALLDSLPELQSRLVFCWDRDWEQLAAYSAEAPPVAIGLERLAYVIYTSGTSGRPKGVMIPHRALLNYALAARDQFELTPTDRMLQFASISFDTAAEEILPTLMTGATLVLRSDEMLQPDVLLQACRDQQLTVLDLPTAYWQQFTQSLITSSLTPVCLPPSLRLMIIGGEAACLDTVLAWRQTGIRLLNTYGPSETTIVATWWQVPPQGDLSTVAIGEPIPHVQTYVLDVFLNPVPTGVAGELYIGGASVAQGYLNQPQLTAERFLPNPYLDPTISHPLQSTRLYRTGDRVRYLADGQLEFLGRFDQQIKLRGIRIEPREIEALLEQHPAVQTAIVVRQSQGAEPQLVAYYLPAAPALAADAVPSASDLRSFLSGNLPLPLLPAAFVPLETLPFTPSGKVDRRRLAARPLPESELPSCQSRPATPTEELLIGIWSTVLERSAIGIYDSFFELGGHSLRATQVMSQIRQIFQVEIPLRYIFEQPTIVALAHSIDQFQRTNTQPETAILSIDPSEHSGSLPLSYAQQRQWFLAQLEPDSPFYNIPVAVRIRGPLNPVLVQRSFNHILDRHQVLRSTFQTVAGQPVQQIVSLSLALPVIDLSGLPEPVQTQQIQRWADWDAKQPFALNCPPLLRLKLLRLSTSAPEPEHILLLTLHHIVADGWSIGILLRELTAFYSALQQGQPALLPPLPIQYADFAAWQRRQDPSEALAYWTSQLQDAPVLELPTDYPRPAVRSLRGANHRFQLSPALTQGLHQLSRQMGCTLFMTLLTAFKILLHRYTDQDDIVVGTVIANRNRAELEGLIGFFVNTLALRSSLAGNPTVETLLHQIRETALAAYAHQDLPFEQLVDALHLQRSLSYTPLFQTLFVLQNAPLPAVEIAGLTWSPVVSDSGTAKFDLTLSMQEEAGHLRGTIEYSLDLFVPETIQRMVDHFHAILEGMATDPDQRLSDLSLLTSNEQHTLHSGQCLQPPLVTQYSIHQLFEQRVTATPDAVALVSESEQLSYMALNAAANQLGHYLQSLGVTSGEPIGIYLDRSPELIISILAILKIGGVYVPLDRSYPTERLAFILADARIKRVLTHSGLPELISNSPIQWINLDAEQLRIAACSSLNPALPVSAEELAYIMYTSGSTGTPKGVCIPHRGVVRLVHQQNYVELNNEIILHAAPTAFDASTFEIWGALLNSGRLVLLPAPQPDLTDLGHAIAQHQISTLWLTAGLFHLMVEEQMTSLKPLRQLLAGGDALSSFHVQQLVCTHPQIQLINGYGPTENTTFTCCHRIQADGIRADRTRAKAVSLEDLSRGSEAIEDLNPVPIGVPIAGTDVYLLDRYLQPVPMGVPGELYAAGAGLAQGYLNQPALTAEVFIPNPFTPGSRLYKTGDRARYRPDGAIEYLGRIDQQVKIRGFRVEPDEIAAVLQQHPAVQSAIVTPQIDDGAKRLIAYVVGTEPHQPCDTASLRDFLKAKLPDYMMPTAFVALAALPLTANGKVDRRALPRPAAPSSSATAPRTATEATLCQIWTAVLGRPVGIDDNFFEQGGDSILAIQIVSRARQAGLMVTPKQVFQHQTIAELAVVIDQSSQLSHQPAALAEQGPVIGPVPLTPIQHWFFEQALPQCHHYNQAVLLQARLPLDRVSIEQTLAALLRHHDALRSRFAATAAGWQQTMAPPLNDLPLIEIEGADRFNSLPYQDIERQIERVAQQLQDSLDLESELLRVAWLRLGPLHGDRLLFVVHHLVIDGVSWRILLDDFQTVYGQVAQGQPIQLSPKTTSVRQWAERLQSYATSADLQPEVDYWRAFSPQPATLPADFPDAANTIATSESIHMTLSVEQTQALLTDVPRAYNARVQEILLTALAQTLSEWTGQRSLWIDLESHGREQPWDDIDLSRSVGWFTTIAPVRLTLSTDPIETNVQSIQNQIRDASNHALSYGVLRYLRPDLGSALPALRMHPNLSFNYLGQLDSASYTDQSLPLLERVQQPIGSTQSVLQPKRYRLEINAAVSKGQLHLEWSYSRDQYRSSTIQRLTERFHAILLHLIAVSQANQPPLSGYRPSGALVKLDATQFDAVLAQVSFEPMQSTDRQSNQPGDQSSNQLGGER